MEAYCMKCKTKREMNEPQAAFQREGLACDDRRVPRLWDETVSHGQDRRARRLTPPEKPAKVEKPRHGKLVIVESPAKAKTVGRFLGKGYTVRASVGHIRDLLRSSAFGGCGKQFHAEVSCAE